MLDLMIENLFQFLLGTLKTCEALFHLFSAIVSIPLRYAKNPCTGYHARFEDVFQFLLGTLKTVHYEAPPPGEDPVSIPLRYAKNGYGNGLWD